MKGDGSLKRRGQVYWMQFYRNGERIRMSSGTTVKEEAKNRLRAEIQKSKTSEWLTPEARKVTVGELVDDCIYYYHSFASKHDHGMASEARWKKHLKSHFDQLRADQFGSAQQQSYRAARKAEGASDTTVNRELQVIRKSFKLAYEAEPPKVSRMPKFLMTPEDNARKVFIASDVADKLRRAAAQLGLWQRAMIEIGLVYGWRRGELEGLLVRQVDLVDATIRLDATKNGDAREVPIPPSLHILLQALCAGRPADAKVFSDHELGFAWEKICALAGVKSGKKDGIVFHDCRRSSARNKRAAGVSESVIMQMHGWRTAAMFRRYAIVDLRDMSRAIEMEAATGTATVQPQTPSMSLKAN